MIAIKNIVQSRFTVPPYSLHDAHIIGMKIENDTLTLVFDYGYIETTPPYEQVQGNISIAGIDWGFCNVYLMEYTDVLCGNYGNFQGKKIPLHDFICKSDRMSVDVIDETYGYNQLKLGGFFSLGNDMQECIFEIYYTGELSYLIEEKSHENNN